MINNMLVSKWKEKSLIIRWFLLLAISSSVFLATFKVLEFRGIPSHALYQEQVNEASTSHLSGQSVPASLFTRIGASVKKHFAYREGILWGDSWIPMVLALKHVKKSPEIPVYGHFFQKDIKFQYPLTSLLLFDIPHRIFGVPYDLMIYILRLFSLFSLFLIGYVCSRTLWDILERPGLQRFNIPRSERLMSLCLIVTLICLFYPLYKGYMLGQIQTILTLLTSLVILCWNRDKKILAGVILGLICLVKPQLGLLFLWAIIRKQWKFVLSGMIVLLVFGIVSIALYGLHNNLDYLHILSFLSKHGEAYYPNQSVNGLMNRLLSNGSNLIWDNKFPPYSPLVHITTLISSAFIIFSGLMWNYKQKQPHVMDLGIMILCATVGSPIAWEHHYGVLFPIFIIVSPFALLYFYERKKWFLITLGASYLLCSLYFEITKSLAGSVFNVVQSYLFFGAVIVLIMLYIISVKINKSTSQLDESNHFHPK